MKKIIGRILAVLGIVVGLFVLAVTLFMNFAPTFGGEPDEANLAILRQSPHFDGEKFVNLVETSVETQHPDSSESMFAALMSFMNPPAGKNPAGPLPSFQLKADSLTEGSFVWLGHSSVLMRTDQLTILADPVFYNASPVPGTVKPFAMDHLPKIADLPASIDVVIISHDHYDHLDYQSIQQLDDRVGQFFVPLGIKAHLLRWGVAEEKIQERDWYDQINHQGVEFIMTPARHFSGRGFGNRFSTLWCSWVIQGAERSIFFNGDSGYFDEYQKIGTQFGPFDIAFMENGAYDKDWSEIHMMPEESVQASIELQAKVMFPIHWGKFDLAKHPWNDPILRTDQQSQLQQVTVATPLIGEIFRLESVPQRKWWKEVAASEKMLE
ncbi:MAG: MBL fold metallo-hydrolase [Bacteroidota bacterium]